MKKLFILLIVVCLWNMKADAQNYTTAIGLRGGWGTGVSIKQSLNSSNSVEGIVDSRWHGLSVTGLYEIHKQAFDTDRLNWYYGFGAHIGFWDGDYYRDYNNKNNYTVIGADGILGLEYNFRDIPFNIGIDWKPVINLTGSSGFYGDGGALSIRYIF